MADDLDASRLPKLKIEAYKTQKFDKVEKTWQVLLNPSDYTLVRSNNYNSRQAAGTSKPSTSASSGNPDQLNCSFFFDGTGVVGDPGPVTQKVADFLDLMSFKPDKHKPYY